MLQKLIMRKLYIILILFFCFNFSDTYAQFKLDLYSGMSLNQVEQPALYRLGHSPYFENKNIFAFYNLDLNLNKRNEKAINSLWLNFGYNFNIKEKPLKLSLFYMYKPVSHILNSQNMGLILNYSISKWEFSLGNNTNIYSYLKKAQNTFEITENTRLINALNMMYSIKYLFLNKDKTWNIYLNLSNFNNILIDKEINPMLNFGSYYKFQDKKIKIFMDLWYQQAGLCNIRVNYYGFLLNLGLTWEI